MATRKALSIQHKDIFKSIHRSQHCQRNWNLDKKIPQEDIDMIMESITQCPSKQNRAFYKVHLVQDRDIIETIHSYSDGCGQQHIGPTFTTTNTQVLAHLCIIFEQLPIKQFVRREYGLNLALVQKIDLSTIDFEKHIVDTDLVAEIERDVLKDQNMAMGIAAGYANLSASLLGYSTGCCACFDGYAVKDLLGLESAPELIMGIGIPGEKPRRVHHYDDSITFRTNKKQPIPVTHF